MRLGIIEFVGWCLAIIGLALTGLLVYLAVNRYVFEAMALSLPSVIVFRSGIGLVKMASAGRIATSLTKQDSILDPKR
ncbi:MAG: hypothetical protein P8J33_16665 [Pirellulaceae bacterium]|nr:hypothetical protein [Pirellulaceae bacterium]